MSIPTSIYENGRWVTRYQDVHHVLAQNRDPETIKVKEAAEAPKPPSLGLLTQTVVRTPVVNWIIPARIRHPEKNDVLYVSAESVEIKEAHGDYTLHHVATKDDFDSPIRAARICGLRRELTKPDINTIIRREEHWRDDVHYHQPGHGGQPLDQESDIIVKEEIDTANALGEDDVDEADLRSMRAVPLHTRVLSPHILVLTLESGKLVFMYTVSGDASTPHIVTSQRPLWRGHNPSLEQVGRYLTVDNRSRATAIAAQERFFYWYALKPMEELQKEVRKRPQIKIIISEQAFEVDGTILRMEFLHPPHKSHHLVTLLLVVCKSGKSRLVWYEWDSTQPLTQAHIKPFSHVLPNDERMPSLLIPMTALTAFILVCESHITLYSDLSTGKPIRYIHHLSHRQDPEEAGTSKKRPIWVQWARVMRSWTHRAQGDGVYLCREDGIVHFLALRHSLPGLIDSNHQVGRLGTNIDTSFAVLDVGPHSSDLLAAGGDGSEGGLWRFDARELAKKITNSPNWTPVMDLCSATVPKKLQDIQLPRNGKWGDDHRMFACVGKAKQGAISEIRYGILAARSLSISLKDILDSGILAVWAFHSPSQATSYLILSHPKQTYLVRIRPDGNDEENSLVDIIEKSPALGLNERTIAVRATSEGRIIQITERAVWGASLAVLDDVDPGNCFHHDFDVAWVLAACVEVSRLEALTLVAIEDRGRYFLQLALLDNMYKVIGDTLETEFQPTAVCLTRIGSEVFVFVGYVDRTIHIIVKGNNSGQDSLKVTYRFEGDFSVCESIAVSTPIVRGNGDFVMLVGCGLRDGSVHTLQFQRKGTSYQRWARGKAVVGDTPVYVVATTSDPVRFIAHCDGQLFSLECRSPEWHGDMMHVHRIWLSDEKVPEWQQGQFSAIAIAANSEASPFAEASELICVDRNNIHVATIDYTGGPQNVHRRIEVDGSPTRVVYSKHLRKLIVLNHRVLVIRPSRTVDGRIRAGKRTVQPLITFMDPDGTNNGSLDDDAMDIDQDDSWEDMSLDHQSRTSRQYNCEAPSYEPGEKFLGVTEWFPKQEDKEFHLLVVNTIIKAERNRPATGRLLLFSVQIAGDRIRLELKKEASHRAPVSAVTAHPNKSALIYHCGDDLRVLRLETSPTGPRSEASVQAQLRSPARHITIEQPYIYVSTAGDSLAVFRENHDSLEYSFSDTVARQCLQHINIPYPRLRLIITADMGGSITGLWQPPHPPRIDGSLSTLFEASFPRAIVRLRPVTTPIWLRLGVPVPDSQDHEKAELEWLSGRRLLIGISACGAVTQHKLLQPNRWPFLRFMQNLAERSPIVCPFRDGPTTRHLDPTRSTKPETRAVNGDILMRLLNRGGVELIWSLMNKPPVPEERYLDFDNVEERWARFRELFLQYLNIIGDYPNAKPFGKDDERLKESVLMALRHDLVVVL